MKVIWLTIFKGTILKKSQITVDLLRLVSWKFHFLLSKSLEVMSILSNYSVRYSRKKSFSDSVFYYFSLQHSCLNKVSWTHSVLFTIPKILTTYFKKKVKWNKLTQNKTTPDQSIFFFFYLIFRSIKNIVFNGKQL
jgi:hypothetical protein